MKQGKLFPLSVLFLTCCSLQAAAERNLTTNMAPAATLSAMQSVRAQQTSGTEPLLIIQESQLLVQLYA